MSSAGWNTWIRSHAERDDEMVGLDDDDLEELQCLLWKGYQPPKYVSVIPDELLFYRARGEVPHYIDQPRVRREKRRRQRGVWQGPLQPATGTAGPLPRCPKGHSQFQCAHCLRWFLAPQTEEETTARFEAAFGDVPKQNRIALCEPCYDRAHAAMVAGLSGTAQ